MNVIHTPAGKLLDGQIVECTCGACYACEREAIDVRALAIVAREHRVLKGFMTAEKLHAHAWTQANLYRTKAINALAWKY